jgi:hypothetical protein
MATWYNQIVKDITVLPDCIEYFEAELQHARADNLRLRGKQIEQVATELPGIVEYRYNQLQEIEAILEFLNIELRKKRSFTFRKYLENYQRALSSRDVEKYVDGDQDVVDMALLVNEFALVRNKWIGLSKAIDIIHWQINNIVKLRVVGLDDATL